MYTRTYALEQKTPPLEMYWGHIRPICISLQEKGKGGDVAQ